MQPQQRDDGQPRGDDDDADDHDGDILPGRQTQDRNGDDKEHRVKDSCHGDGCQHRSQGFDNTRLLPA